MKKLSRREFIAISCLPILVPKAVAGAAAFSNDAGLSIPPSASDDLVPPPGEGLATDCECLECRGLGAITCPACDGTGIWTGASEFAGLYQREAARASGHCAWCNDWGEAARAECNGTGTLSDDECQLRYQT